ncbi:hypothetical protein ACJX0J_037753 [Zea mays]
MKICWLYTSSVCDGIYNAMFSNLLYHISLLDMYASPELVQAANSLIDMYSKCGKLRAHSSILNIMDVNLGVHANKLFDIEPENAGNYVILSNIYAAARITHASWAQ